MSRTKAAFWRCGATVATIVAALATVVLVLNVQATAVPLVALLPALPAGSQNHDLADTVNEIRAAASDRSNPYGASRLRVGRSLVLTTTSLVLGVTTLAYGSDRPDTSAVRRIKGRTIISGESPKANLSIGKGFRFVGTQPASLHGNADAEQYVFARSGRDNIVESFYLIQFERFLPTNTFTYDYASMRATQMGDLQFNYDVRSWPDLGALLREDRGSDGAAMEQLFAKRHLVLPQNAVLVRMFHLPSADHRTELMILYGEALPRGSAVPVRKGGVQLDTESPAWAERFLGHARQGLVVQTR